MTTDAPPPLWLWRLTTRGFVVCLLAVLALAAGLALGWADPPRAGPLLWQDDFKQGLARWQVLPPAGGTLAAQDGALLAEFGPGPEAWAAALTTGPAGDYTLEAAGTPLTGTPAYGLVFGWQDAAHYNAVFINGDGYAEAYQQAGAQRQTLFQWQQWPQILYGTETNRVRVDVRGAVLTVRINDEVLAADLPAGSPGQVGVAARGTAPGQVVFSWVRLWARTGFGK